MNALLYFKNSEFFRLFFFCSKKAILEAHIRIFYNSFIPPEHLWTGKNVVYYRKKKRLTQLELAELAEVDLSHISAIELGKVGVSFDVIFKLCEVLDVKPKELFDFRD